MANTANTSENTHHPVWSRVFDGHNDVLSKLRNAGDVESAHLFQSESDFHVDKVKAARGNFGGGFFAMWVATPDAADYQSMMVEESYDVPLPEPVGYETALDVVLEQAAILLKLQEMNALTICTNTEHLRACIINNDMAAIMHLEGCEAIDPDLHTLDVLYAAGLRSLGPVWSRSTIYAEGVPFRYPSSPDIGPGLTDAGIALIKRCNQLGIMIDLSHLNLKGFHDVAKHSNAPLVATHSNAHAICPHARNLTDEQLDMIRASKGMVGLNFASAFLRNDGRMLTDVPVEQMLRHLDYLLSELGEHGVGLGSDFDGAEVPDAIADVSGLPVLIGLLEERGYGESLIARLCHENWLDVLERTWRPHT